MATTPLPISAIPVLDDAVLASIQTHGFTQLLDATLATALTAAARHLNLTPAVLSTELAAGRSLAELAAARAVPRDELVSLITNALFLAQAHHPGRLPRPVLEEQARFLVDERRRGRHDQQLGHEPRHQPGHQPGQHNDAHHPTDEQPARPRLVRVAPPEPHVLDVRA
jgi:hypothetical protein